MCSEPCQTSKMERFAKLVKRLSVVKLVLQKRSMLDVWQCTEKASDQYTWGELRMRVSLFRNISDSDIMHVLQGDVTRQRDLKYFNSVL